MSHGKAYRLLRRSLEIAVSILRLLEEILVTVFFYRVGGRCLMIRDKISHVVTAVVLITVSLLFITTSARAQTCTGPSGTVGDIIYSMTYDAFQGCTPDGWVAFNDALSAPACLNPGDICPDGTIYAGQFNGNKLYAAVNDATPSTWGPRPSTSGMGFCVSGVGGSCDTGRENTQLLKDHASTFLAAEYCSDVVVHGHDDWYLPSIGELLVVYGSLYAGNPPGTHNFLNANYWSSSESSTTNAWYIQFTNGGGGLALKDSSYRVRCIRR